LDSQGQWQSGASGWEGKEGKLKLQGWSRLGRVLVLRQNQGTDKPLELEARAGQQLELVKVAAQPDDEDTVLVTRSQWKQMLCEN
jgi:hypothetical protein